MSAQSVDSAAVPGRRVWLLAAALLAGALAPWLLPLEGTGAPVLWWASRAFGFVSYVALWLAMLTGVLVGAKGLDGWIDRKTLVELHQQWSLAGVIATAVHVLAVVTNEHAEIDVAGALVPFAAERLTAPLGVGVLAFWLLAAVVATSWLRTGLPYAAWRAVHTMAFGAFVLALVHSVSSGTDSSAPLVQWLYLVTGALLVGVIVTRLLLASARAAKPSARREAVGRRLESAQAGGARSLESPRMPRTSTAPPRGLSSDA